MNKNIFKGLFAALLCMATVFSYAQTNQRYYWVGQGGNSNWGNLENWSNESGGSTHPSFVPGATNTVIFNGNSGLTASNKTINIVGMVRCDSLIIENSVGAAPLFNFASNGDNFIIISGSFLNHGGAKAQNPRVYPLQFNSIRQNESILMNDFFYSYAVADFTYPYFCSIRFVGTGKWNIMDDFGVAGLYITSGTVDMSNHNFNGSEVFVETNARLIFANSIIKTNLFGNSNTSATALTETESAGSLIKIGSGYFGSRTNQVYNNVEFVSNIQGSTHYISAGTFKKVTINTRNGIYIAQSSVGYSCTIDSLIINTESEVKFGLTTVNKLFQAKPTTCGGQVKLSSNNATTKSTYFLSLGPSAVVDVQNAIIYNLVVSGTQLYAVNSYDWGGNLGSIYIEEWTPTGRDMYWIGGGGSNSGWNNPAKWSLSSGGPSANCVPTLADNVFFDNNSGTINGDNAIGYTGEQGYCHNMTALGVNSGAPYFGMNVNVGGSLVTQANTRFGNGSYTFVSNTNEIIDFNNNTANMHIDFYFRSLDGNGHWKFMSNFYNPENVFYLYRGSVDMSGLSNTTQHTFNSDETDQDNPNLGILSKLSSRYFDISNSTITTNTWNSRGGQAVAADKTNNSLIKGFTNSPFYISTKNGDRYYNIEHNGVTTNGSITCNTGTAYAHKITLKGKQDFNINSGSYTGSVITDSVVIIDNAVLYLAKSPTIINQYIGTTDNCSFNPRIQAVGLSNVIINLGTALSKSERVKIYYATINNVSINTPEGDYDVTDCTLQGTSTGWNTTEPLPQTYYWVGGAGTWNDSKHWSKFSGLNGGYYNDGTGCTPTYRDDVIFDNGSSVGEGNVTIGGIASCNNMSWLQTEDCGFSSYLGTTTTSIYGSLILQKDMSFCTFNTVYFMSTRQNETLQMNGYAPENQNGGWRFDGGGSWKLLDSLNIKGCSLYIDNGHVDFSGQYVYCWQITYSGFTNPVRSLDIRNATLDLQSSYSFGGVGIQAENSTIYFGTNFTVPDTTTYHNIIAVGNDIRNITANIVDKIEIRECSNVTFKRGFKTDTLMLANNVGNIYNFESGKTFTVNKAYYGSGTPCLPIYLRSDDEPGHAIFDFKRPTANYDNVFGTDFVDTLLIDYAYIHGIEAKTNDNNAMLIKGVHAPDNDKSGTDAITWGYGDGTDNNNVAWATGQPFTNTATPFPVELDLPCTAWGSKFSCKTYFLPNYASTFKWRKGTINDPVVSEEIYVVLDEEAQYVCTVDYGNNCTATDSVNIIMTPADTLVWVGADRNYYNLANWTIRNNGSPAVKLPDGCTDIYIPAGLTNYPDLSPGITNYGQEFYEIAAAKNIWFEHGGDTQAGGELARPDSLHYAKAFVNIRLKPLRWYNLTAPLMDMYSGDFAFDHINPLVEMRLFKTESPQNGEMAIADWTTPFSTDTVRLNTADGFSVRVGSVYYPDDQFWADKDWGLIEGAVSVNITDTVWQFPKDNIHWDFYHERTKEKVGQTQDLPLGLGGRNYADRFTFESQKGSLSPGYVAQKIVPDGYATREVIIGNPFMSHFDFAEFYRANHNVILPQFYLLPSDGAYQTFSAVDNDGFNGDGEFDASPAPSGNPIIAPMQSIIVTLRDAVPTFFDQPINFTDIMSISNTTASGILRKPTLTENRLASISASRGLYGSEAFVQTSQEAHNAFAEGEDALLLKSEGLSNLAIDVFTVADGKYLSVNRINEEFDTIHIGLMTKSNKGLTTIVLKDIPTLSEDEQYFFEDKALAITLPITDNEFSYQFDNQVGNVIGRFAIYKTPAIINGVQDPKVTDNGAQAFIYGDMLNVVSKDGSAIQAIMIYDTKGVLIYENQNVNSTSWQMPAAKVGSQVLIVKVVTTNGAYAIKVTGNK